MLPDPFFRLKNQKFFPDGIKDPEGIFPIFESEGIFRKIKFLHVTKMLIQQHFTKKKAVQKAPLKIRLP